jgi:hypothetical protein
MEFTEVVKAALELGVIPALALFLVVAMHLQNRQLLKDRREIELTLLRTLAEIITEKKEQAPPVQVPSDRLKGNKA